MSTLLLPLQYAINKYLQLSPETIEQLRKLKGKIICIQLMPIKLKLYFIPVKTGLNLTFESKNEPDITISGSPFALARMHWNNKQGKLLLDSEVDITGDATLGQKFQDILESIDIDWEEHLSKLTGDVIAYNIGNLFRRSKSWCQSTQKSAETLFRDYLQEETKQLPPKEEVEDFLQDIDELRNDAERLFARWTILREDNAENKNIL